MTLNKKALSSLILKTAAIGASLFFGLPALGLTAPLIAGINIPFITLSIASFFTAGLLNNNISTNSAKNNKIAALLGLALMTTTNLYLLLPLLGINISLPIITAIASIGTSMLLNVLDKTKNEQFADYSFSMFRSLIISSIIAIPFPAASPYLRLLAAGYTEEIFRTNNNADKFFTYDLTNNALNSPELALSNDITSGYSSNVGDNWVDRINPLASILKDSHESIIIKGL